MKVYAVSDIHLSYEENRRALEALGPHPEDWLVIAGDMGPLEDHLTYGLEILTPRFAKILWTPGNHDLWTLPQEEKGLKGDAKYRRLVAICREYQALTPEDPFPACTFDGQTYVIAPMFLLYDYTFRPDHVPAHRAVSWAAQQDTLCVDEHYLFPDPHPTREAWCEARSVLTEQRLAEIPRDRRLVLVNHFPLRQDQVRLGRIPRFSIWCGTRRTEDWHRRFNAAVVVTGHLHVPATDWRDGVRFEEVSLGYPRQWRRRRKLGMEGQLREILPGDGQPGSGVGRPLRLF